MQQAGRTLLDAAGFERYEISAYAQQGRQCRHNLNYWQFGDYLGIGAGAHAKISDAGTQVITRVAKVRHPRSWLETAHSAQRISTTSSLAADDVVLEFAMNALRLEQGFSPTTFTATTGLPYAAIGAIINKGIADGLLALNSDTVKATQRGQRYLNELLQHWMPEATHNA
jgi:oxygen-independent coproporphyrinogen-3 oxidase